MTIKNIKGNEQEGHLPQARLNNGENAMVATLFKQQQLGRDDRKTHDRH